MDWKQRAEATEERLRRQFMSALAGDAAAYQRFLTALSAHLRAFFRKRMSQLPDDVEDLVQECLLAVHHSRHTYKPEQPLTAWVHTIARYKLIDFLRSRSRREALNDPLEDDLQVFAASDTEAAEARRDLEQVLQSLPQRQRRALVMMKLEGASVAETALATGLSEASVKVGVHRSLKALSAKVRSGA
jgi:RNA polymerase sigma-70 factor, ECF subfamily